MKWLGMNEKHTERVLSKLFPLKKNQKVSFHGERTAEIPSVLFREFKENPSSSDKK